MRFVLPIVLSLVVVGPAHAQTGKLDQLEERLELHRIHQQRLEAQLEAVGERITRLKQQPSGVGRDYQLNKSLRSSQGLAEKLTSLNRQLRRLRANLLSAYDRTIRRTKDRARRTELRARRKRIAEGLTRKELHIVTSGKHDPLDGFEDLEEKADLLQDSQEKVSRQLSQVERRLNQLQRRAKLARHGRDADDTLFVESVPRRVGGTRTITQQARAGGNNSGGDNFSPQRDVANNVPNGVNFSRDVGDGNLQADAPGGVETNSPSGGTPFGPGSIQFDPAPASSVTVRDTIDPATFRDLEEGQPTPTTVEGQIAALRRAQAKLRSLQNDLKKKESALRDQAKRIKTEEHSE